MTISATSTTISFLGSLLCSLLAVLEHLVIGLFFIEDFLILLKCNCGQSAIKWSDCPQLKHKLHTPFI